MESLVAAVGGRSDLGLTREAQRFRVRVLDPSAAPSGGLADFTTTVAELAGLDLHPRVVLIVENLASLAALPTLAGVVAVHGRGYAVTQLADVPWVKESPIVYWGDLDSHGLAILGRLRALLPHASSVLMNRDTLRHFIDRAVPELRPHRGDVDGLTAEETATLDLLREHGLRLEQERLDVTYAHDHLARRLG